MTASSRPQVDHAQFELLQRRVSELEEENAALVEKVASLESDRESHLRVCLGLVQTAQPHDQAVKFRVNDNAVDSKPPMAMARNPSNEDNKSAQDSKPAAEQKRKEETAIKSITSPSQILADLSSVDIDKAKIVPTNDSKTGTKLERPHTQPLVTGQSNSTKRSSSPSSPLCFRKVRDVKPKYQLEVVVPAVPNSVRKLHLKNSNHNMPSTYPSTLNSPDVGSQDWDDRQSMAGDSGVRGSDGTPDRGRSSVILDDESMSELTDLEDEGKDIVDRKKVMDSYKNPTAKVQVKKTAISLSFDSVYERIKTVGHGLFDIKAPDSLVFRRISRRFLSNVYGGNMQAMYSHPDKSFVEKHGIKSFMCLITEYNPHAPIRPGSPGLFFGDDEPLEWPNPSERVFTRVEPGKWEYQGDYKFVRCKPLTPAEYCSLGHVVRHTWTKGIAESGWGLWTRARILLRTELGREPRDREIAAKKTVLNANKHLDTVTAEQVEAAFATGKEVIGIWAMKCIAYDVAFQTTLIQNFDSWVPPEPKKKKKTKPKGAKPTKGRGKPSSTKDSSSKSPSKRRRPRSPSIISSDSHESSDNIFDEVDSDNEIEIIYDNIRSLGTKSRPGKRARLESEVF
ncbi:hypothetical protein BD410DRAFT_786866 [Rickenella mellea]|uniref:DUF6697 domain-containing protein n=1 Tax=Rickenella mellea TaxID=50990 RepID=A0A4Y7Q8K3_9AGAM|nr:hypothetical protein BD410DRAFT_786866 [Rickenella mellea]